MALQMVNFLLPTLLENYAMLLRRILTTKLLRYHNHFGKFNLQGIAISLCCFV